ncbi:hypothetical protein CEUSTIGMA_g8551.t1 [Chlamydomonas eustigma]|uniref:RRM domain-containing protein n=1 Tax=Chlamydomonas eustigma TaxID=1157962 RepID=A0A250XDF2_9CHLO|nr:hypothetical protein CEUSTIGMA_g8551.t1 [Chlamydomonas eustigma]|eukprot:GAX81117.1 hypothetical protein CEUSTIGMA_g8551.t1 [Chlamydomonas eustigma]
MNPLTQIKNTQKATQREIALGLSDSASWHAEFKHSAYVFVGGLDYELTEGDVLAVFSQYGEIVDLNLVRDKATGKPRGFAFVAYEDQRSTNLAVDNLSGATVAGRIVRVQHVKNYKKQKAEMDGEEVPDEDPTDGRNQGTAALDGSNKERWGGASAKPAMEAPWDRGGSSTSYAALLEEARQLQAARQQAQQSMAQDERGHAGSNKDRKLKKDKKGKKEKKDKKDKRKRHNGRSDSSCSSDGEEPERKTGPVPPGDKTEHWSKEGGSRSVAAHAALRNSFGPPKPPSQKLSEVVMPSRGGEESFGRDANDVRSRQPLENKEQSRASLRGHYDEEMRGRSNSREGSGGRRERSRSKDHYKKDRKDRSRSSDRLDRTRRRP